MGYTEISSTISLTTTSGHTREQLDQAKQGKQERQIDGFLNTKILQRAFRSALVSLLVCSLALCLVSNEANAIDQAPNNLRNYHQASHDEQLRALEADLSSILQQNEGGGNDKLLAEAIINRWMVDNLTGPGLLNGNNNANEQQLDGADLMSIGDAQPGAGELVLSEFAGQESAANPDQQQTDGQAYPNGLEVMRLRRLLSMLQNYENTLTSGSAGQNFAPFPLLPNSQVATMKRAAMRMGAYLQPRNSQAAGYGRDSFGFGLGKRGPGRQVGLIPAASSILRFGDSLSTGGGGMQPVGSLGKRPSAHRFDFGLGKRVASVSVKALCDLNTFEI